MIESLFREVLQIVITLTSITLGNLSAGIVLVNTEIRSRQQFVYIDRTPYSLAKAGSLFFIVGLFNPTCRIPV